MGRFSVDSSEEEGDPKKRRLDRGKVVTSESEEAEAEAVESDEGDEDGSDSDGELNFRINTDVLDCTVCFEPLHPPIFQCRNGHIACSSCCPKLSNKCPVCSLHIGGRYRCLALENVIESIKCRCRYARYGCRTTPSFAEKASHEQRCSHVALFCPFNNCNFSNPKQILAAHVEKAHFKLVTKFMYGQPFTVTLPRREPFMALLDGKHGDLFLVLNNFSTYPGNALSLICINSNGSEFVFKYELRVHNTGSTLQLRTVAEKVKKWNGVHPTDAFLMVPYDFCTFGVEIAVNVCIQRSSGTLK